MSSEFSSILKNSKDITDDVYRDPVDYQSSEIISLFVASKKPEEILRKEIEKLWQEPCLWDGSKVGILCDLPQWSNFAQEEYKKSRPDLFAIDATDSPLISLMVGQFYEVVVGGVGYFKTDLTPQIFRASTTLSIKSDVSENVRLEDLIKSFEFKKDRSWPNTYREYKEREYALECESNYVIVDGPILTQNLVTQREGEELICKIAKSSKKVLGVIKSLSASTDHERWVGRILKNGEAYILMNCGELLAKRNESWGKGKKKQAWLNSVASQFCRGVYRPGNPDTGHSSYFGFECKIKDIPWALSVLYNERSSIPGHEIPFLLDHIDALLDATHNRGSVQKRLEAALMEYDPCQAFDQLDTNDFRNK